MTLIDFGYNEIIGNYVNEHNSNGFTVGRIISEKKERYIVFTEVGEYEAEVTGNLRFSAQGREDFPAVGDWVFLNLYDNNFAIINSIIPRYSKIERRAIEKQSEAQIIAANIDYAIIVVAADRDFNLNRIERYLAICNDSNIKSFIAITKIDLFIEKEIYELEQSLLGRIKNVPTLMLSNKTLSGFNFLHDIIVEGKTYCLLGSSGVGKSTLLNNLYGKEVMKTGNISSMTNKGKHVTTFRELIVLENGGIIIDNPGMREVGITNNKTGIDTTFSQIAEIAQYCKFSDCTHMHEAGCAVLAAIESGEIGKDIYENYLKIEKENRYFASTRAENHQKDKKFGKMIKNYNKDKNLNKF
jgi:ribosome biogenesis GTPase / thiamine phosphate phosphatase